MTTTVSGDTGVSQCQPDSVSQDDLKNGVVGKGPAFRAYRSGSSQSVSASTWTTVQLNAESFDTNNAFDISTYKFTPQIAGYYLFNAALDVLSTGGAVTEVGMRIMKNGVTDNMLYISSSTMSTNELFALTTIMYLNGTTDYAEFQGIGSGGSSRVFNSTTTNFAGVLVRAA